MVVFMGDLQLYGKVGLNLTKLIFSSASLLNKPPKMAKASICIAVMLLSLPLILL